MDNFEAITTVSAAQLGGESKDQDRACWSGPNRTAGLADGVTTSPYGERAAKFLCDFCPALFRGPIEARLGAATDLLMTRRLEAQASQPATPAGMEEGMEAMLRDVAREKMAQSYQSTFVGANFILVDDVVAVSVVWCGDSAFLAFSPQGDVLSCSLSIDAALPVGAKASKTGGISELSTFPVRFGDELLCKVIADAAERPLLAEMASIPKKSSDKWLVCTPLDLCAPENGPGSSKDTRVVAVQLAAGDCLLVPKYLVGTPKDPRYKRYRSFNYSPAVRPLLTSKQNDSTKGELSKGSLTAVLPDHYYRGEWTHLEDRFPQDTQFVLASDGFYGGFPTIKDLWGWLNDHRSELLDEVRRQDLLLDLHKRLHETHGDDDISFVWISRCNQGQPEIAVVGDL
jgi:hypothetical protein